jgi:predicted GH43/DUF377 family glycosyl hydrolase
MKPEYVVSLLISMVVLTGCWSRQSVQMTDTADHPVVLEPGVNGEWDAGAIGSTCILRVGNTYHAFYEAWGELGMADGGADYKSLRIGHATSPDGVYWTKDPANPVILAGAEGEFDCHGTWDPFVIHEDGVFKMWFGGRRETGGNPHVICDWGYATSTDGSTFQKKGRISHVGAMEDLSVVHNPVDGKYYMFYWNRLAAPWGEVMDGVPSPAGLTVAVSDDEIHFDFENAQIITIEGQEWPAKFPHVFRAENQWMMLYGEAKVRGEPASTGIAVSDDLVHWRKAAFPIIAGHDAELVKAGRNRWHLYYAPHGYFDMPDADIRLAVINGKLSGLFDDE